MRQFPYSLNVFIEDIIYCPTQIYYYFKGESDEIPFWLAYIYQRGGPLMFKLIELNEMGGWMGEHKVELSRAYDINNQGTKEAEETEITKLEKEILCFLIQRFPGLTFEDEPRNVKY